MRMVPFRSLWKTPWGIRRLLHGTQLLLLLRLWLMPLLPPLLDAPHLSLQLVVE